MIGYLLRKVLYYGSLQVGLVVVTFLLFFSIPSDPARLILGANASEQEVAVLRHELGLDAPLATQFAGYTQRVARLDFGHSYIDDRPVAPEVTQRLRVSLVLILITLGIALTYAMAVTGVEYLYGLRVGRYLDFAWVSAPTMFSAVAIGLISVKYYPYTAFSGRFASASDWLALIPPAFALALYPMAVLSRILRTEMRRLRNVLFIVAARATGYSERRIFWTFALRNAVQPVLSTLSTLIPLLFTGAFVVEVVFSIPGVGSLLLKSVINRDFPMLQAVVILNGFVVLAAHLLVETIAPLVDPRMSSDGV